MFKKFITGVGIAALSLTAGVPALAATESDSNAVYTASNNPAGNSILVYHRAANGTLTPTAEVATGGLGTGSGLGNQSGLVLSDDGTVLVVNAGSNNISLLRQSSGSLTLKSTTSSGGIQPSSITRHNNIVYVLNAGSDNITGFTLSGDTLQPIIGSTRPLSGTGTGPAQVAFNPDGTVLLVTEKVTNKIDTYTVDSSGVATGPNVQNSSGQTPFGFTFDKLGHAIVSEAFGGAASALSSYAVADTGNLSFVSQSVGATGQKAACWVAVSKNGKFAYTTNTASGTISIYGIGHGHDSMLRLLQAIGANTGNGPIDLSLSNNGQFLYVLNAGSHTIQGFKVNQDTGQLTLITTLTGISSGANGLVAQ